MEWAMPTKLHKRTHRGELGGNEKTNPPEELVATALYVNEPTGRSCIQRNKATFFNRYAAFPENRGSHQHLTRCADRQCSLQKRTHRMIIEIDETKPLSSADMRIF